PDLHLPRLPDPFGGRVVDQLPPARVDPADAGVGVHGQGADPGRLRARGTRALPILLLRRRDAAVAWNLGAPWHGATQTHTILICIIPVRPGARSHPRCPVTPARCSSPPSPRCSLPRATATMPLPTPVRCMPIAR